MKIPLKTSLLISALAVTGVSAMAQSSPLESNRQYSTGVIGVTAGQTARFNVLYPAVPAPLLPIICSATLLISDGQGNQLKTVVVPQLLSGKSASLDLNADTDLPSASVRTEITARAITPQIGGTGASCNLVPTLEIFDNASGKTTVVIGGQITWPVAQVTTPPTGPPVPVVGPLPVPVN
jgi:hypothetical protein